MAKTKIRSNYANKGTIIVKNPKGGMWVDSWDQKDPEVKYGTATQIQVTPFDEPGFTYSSGQPFNFDWYKSGGKYFAKNLTPARKRSKNDF